MCGVIFSVSKIRELIAECGRKVQGPNMSQWMRVYFVFTFEHERYFRFFTSISVQVAQCTCEKSVRLKNC